MPKRRIRESKVEEFIKDELKGMKAYRHYGFKNQSKDEKRHARYFKRKYKKMEKSEKKKKKK